MPALVFQTTDAGRAALVNAANTGTLPVVVSHIGVTATAFTAAADGSNTTLPGELKRLSTFGGNAVADDIIHVTMRDDSADVYSLRGFGLYLADGTLFGLYGQAGVILEKSAQATALLSADVKFADINATDIAFGDTDFLNPPATTEVQGVVELATNTEANTGTDTQRAVTPAGVKHVLDQRFGVGAPSTFIKGLMALTTAALLRAAIEVKSAALKDEGAGNGLDADTVDGKHAADFATAAHSHSWAQITGVVPTWNQNTTGNAATATKLAAARTLTIGNTARNFDGSANLSWTLADIGAAQAAHSHDAGHIVSGTLSVERIPALPVAQTTGLQAALDSKATLGANASFGYLSGILVHQSGYLNVYPYNATYDDGSRIEAYYDGNNRVWRLGVRDANNTGGALEIALGGATFSNSAVRVKSGAPSALNAGNCGLVFSGDSDTGVFSAADGQLILAVNGVAKLTQTATATNFATGITTPSLNASSSDARLKHDIQDMRDCLSLILSLRPSTWRWNDTGEEDFGFIAQKHRKAMPGAVYEDDEGMLFVRYGKAEAPLVGAVQELAARLAKLEAAVFPQAVS